MPGGHGPAPKPKEERRTRHEPQRGEWVDIGPLETPTLPALPKRAKGTGPWSARTKAAWAAWRSDPVTSQYGAAELQAITDLAFIYEEWVRGRWSVIGEIRQHQDRLGLNPKGKRDLRWRIAKEQAVDKPKPKANASQKRAHLTAVK